jgi:O-antigen/teichoic acid export membrane protein
MMGWRMFSRALGFVSMLILARLLMPTDFGVVAVASAVSASVDSLSRLGVRDALVRLHDERRDYFNTAFTFQVARGLLTSLLLVAFSLFASTFFEEARLRWILQLMAIFAAVSAFENIGIVSFTRALNFRTQFFMQVAPRLTGFIVTTVLAFVLRDYRALIWGMGVGSFVGVAASYVVSPFRPGFGLTGWRYLLGFSFWTWAGGLAVVVWSRADAFLLAPVLGTAELGVFLLAAEIAMMPVTELLEPACATLFPGFSLALRQGSAPISMGLMIAGILALGTIPFSIGVSACSGYLVAGLLSPQWLAARPVIAIMAWICMFSPFSYVCGSVLSAHGQVSRAFASNAIAALIKVIVVLIVRQTHDLTVISIAAVLVVAIESSIFIFQLCATGNTELRQVGATMLRASVSTVTTCTVVWLLPGTWAEVTLSRIGALVIGASIGILTFVIFGFCQFFVWRAWGCPCGVEAQIIRIIREILSSNPLFKSMGLAHLLKSDNK